MQTLRLNKELWPCKVVMKGEVFLWACLWSPLQTEWAMSHSLVSFQLVLHRSAFCNLVQAAVQNPAALHCHFSDIAVLKRATPQQLEKVKLSGEKSSAVSLCPGLISSSPIEMSHVTSSAQFLRVAHHFGCDTTNNQQEKNVWMLPVASRQSWLWGLLLRGC